MVKDILTDLVRKINGLEIEQIKVTGTDKETKFNAVAANNIVVMQAKAKKPVADMVGVFGLGNLGILRGYLDIFNSFDDTVVKVNSTNRNGIDFLTDITFKAPGQSSANYRLVGEAGLSKVAMFNAPSWDVSLIPSKTKISQFSRFVSVMSHVEKKFSTIVRDGHLIFQIGDEAASVSRVEIDFGPVDGGLSPFKYPSKEFLNILGNDNVKMNFSKKGVAQIVVDSGLIEYEFVFPGSN